MVGHLRTVANRRAFVARAAIAIALREAAEDERRAKLKLRAAEYTCNNLHKCALVETMFLRDLSDINGNMEYQVHYHMREESPIEIAPEAVVSLFISALQHHMPILAKFTFRRWSGSLTIFLDALFSPMTWDVLLDILNKVSCSLIGQISADESRAQDAEQHLARCRNRYCSARSLRRALAKLL